MAVSEWSWTIDQATALGLYRELLLLERLTAEITSLAADDWPRQLLPAFGDRVLYLRCVLMHQDQALLDALPALADVVPAVPVITIPDPPGPRVIH
jgi:hypothetical protein